MNLLVIPCYQMDDSSRWQAYQEMHHLSVRSYKKHLKGDWKLLTLTGVFRRPDFEQCFSDLQRDQFKRLREMWKAGANVFFVDTDTICQKDTEIFGRWDTMRMPWKTAGYQPNYMNGGVMYFPATMSAKCWELGEREIEDWRAWDDSQVTYNHMAWSQNVTPQEMFDPTLNYSPVVGGPISESEAHIVHFHSSRGFAPVLARMRELSV